MTAQPSASWKLSAMSVPLDSVHTINVSVGVPETSASCSHDGGNGGRRRQTLLLLVRIVLGDLRLQEDAVRLVLRLDEDPGLILRFSRGQRPGKVKIGEEDRRESTDSGSRDRTHGSRNRTRCRWENFFLHR